MSTDHVSTHPDSPLHGNGIGSEAINLAAIRQEYTKGGRKEIFPTTRFLFSTDGSTKLSMHR